MGIFDVVFIVVVLTSVVAIVLVIVAAVRRRRDRAAAIARRLGVAIAAYMIVVAMVALVSPPRSIALGADQCSDDWCIAADSSHRHDDGARTTYTVSLRLSSRARRIAQRERFVVAYLRDARGWRYDALPDPQAARFDTLLQPGEAIRTVRRFVVPTSATNVGLVIGREGGFNFPGCCIIGDENSVWHKRAVVRLDAAR